MKTCGGFRTITWGRSWDWVSKGGVGGVGVGGVVSWSAAIDCRVLAIGSVVNL